MTVISIDSQLPHQPAGTLVNWLRQRIVAYRKKREMQAHQRLLRSLDARLLLDMGIDPNSVRPEPELFGMMPHLVVVSVFQNKSQQGTVEI